MSPRIPHNSLGFLLLFSISHVACSGGGTQGDGGSDGAVGPCPPPAGAGRQALAALRVTNETRAAMGLQCQTMITEINTGAEKHCQYFAANQGNRMCIANPHGEVAACDMFVSDSFAMRMRMAGYTGSPAAEVMAFVNDGADSTQQWIDSIWHRVPVLSPWVGDMGYGGATGCDTIDYGVGDGAGVSPTMTATYPYANQTEVPTRFLGNEGPPPPPPPGGWPSGYPITLYMQGTFMTHTLTMEGSQTNIDHVWLVPGDPRAMGLLRNEAFIYANEPLLSRTRYHVHVTGTRRDGTPHTFDFSFTTGN